MRLATTRASRRRSPLMIAWSARPVTTTSNVGADDTATALRTNWLTLQVLEVQADRPGVEPADLEEIFDKSAESSDVAHQQVEGGLGPFRHLVASRLHHVDRSRESHQR